MRLLVALFVIGCAAKGYVPDHEFPLAFEENVGQTGPSIRFLARGPGYTLFLNAAGAFLQTGENVVRMHIGAANPNAEAVGIQLLPAVSNYLIGSRPADWRIGVRNYACVEFRDVYPGVNLVYRSSGKRLEYDFVVGPHADPRTIHLTFEGVTDMQLDSNGVMVLSTPVGTIRHYTPRVYQTWNGVERKVTARYVIRGNREIGFEVGAYDHTHPLVIDPVIVYSTYLGGRGNGAANGIAVDGSGNVYVAGWTESLDFIGAGSKLAQGGGVDAFVGKLNPVGNAYAYITYFGGRGEDRACGIGVDAAGSPVVAGWTTSGDFPTAAPLRSSLSGSRDGFVVKLAPAGNAFVFSTYWGGSGTDSANAVAADGLGNIYVTGETDSGDFPTLNAFRPRSGGRLDVFVTKFAGNGALSYSTYLGGIADDRATAIAVDAYGSAYVTGSTESIDFPVVSAFQGANAGGQDAFVTRLNAAGNDLVYSTYVGGAGGTNILPEMGTAIAIDAAGNAYVAGVTSSANFPAVNPLQASLAGSSDGFILKLGSSGAGLIYSTYLGGHSSIDQATSIAVDSTGSAYVAGYTASDDFPVAAGLQAAIAGSYDAFVVKLSPTGNALSMGTYLGGKASDTANALALDTGGNIYIAGQSQSLDFPTVRSMQVYPAGSLNAFIAKISPLAALPNPYIFSPVPGSRLNSSSVTFVWNAVGGAQDYSIDIGTAVSRGDILSRSTGGATSTTVDISRYLNGQPIYVQLYSKFPGIPQLSGSGSQFRFETASVSGANFAAGKVASQSSTIAPSTPASAAVDGNAGGSYGTDVISHTNADVNAWWQVDLGASAAIDSIQIWNRTDCCGSRLSNYWIFVSGSPFGPADTPATLQGRSGTWAGYQAAAPNPSVSITTGGVTGRYVRIQLATTGYLSLAEVQVFGAWTTGSSNLAMGKVASQSSTIAPSTPASAAVDGNAGGSYGTDAISHTNADVNAWWQVDLGASAAIDSIQIWNRTDCCGSRLSNYWIFVSGSPFGPADTPATLQGRSGTWAGYQAAAPNPSGSVTTGGVTGRYVRIQLATTGYLSLAEVQVFGAWTTGSSNLAMGKLASQSSTIAPSTPASAAVDGNVGGSYGTDAISHTNADVNPWWQVDLGASAAINSIQIWNRTDCCGSRLSNYWVFVSDQPFASTDTPSILQNRSGTSAIYQAGVPSPSVSINTGGLRGRYIRVQLAGTDYLSLAEVQVFGL